MIITSFGHYGEFKELESSPAILYYIYSSKPLLVKLAWRPELGVRSEALGPGMVLLAGFVSYQACTMVWGSQLTEQQHSSLLPVTHCELET